jgi:cytosine/adenosine deaminase-related metal-dependent hydrolase
MPQNPKLLLRARWLLPVSRPPIRDGAVWIGGNRVLRVGTWADLRRAEAQAVVDLGDSLLMPGLVNAHCHLDYTDMAGQFPPPAIFSDWLKLITATKAGWTFSDYAQSWMHGAEMLVRTGTTTVGDIEAVPQLLPDVWGATPLRVISFLEMIALKPNRPPAAVLQETLDRIARLRGSRCGASLSPHAPYTTVPELLRLTTQAARRRQWRVTTHVAESAMEFEMFARARGAMFDWLQRSGRDMSDCGKGSPVRHMDKCGALCRNLLAVHVNYLARNDAQLLARRGVHVVHCPRSHDYFAHSSFPLRRLLRAGVNVCLGTDSLASVYKRRRQPVELSMFDEMRMLAKNQAALSPKKILAMATVNGAAALGLAGQIGELADNAYADLVAIPCGSRTRNIYDHVLQHTGNVSASMIGGHWAINPAQG